jgi:hypothetical protein
MHPPLQKNVPKVEDRRGYVALPKTQLASGAIRGRIGNGVVMDRSWIGWKQVGNAKIKVPPQGCRVGRDNFRTGKVGTHTVAARVEIRQENPTELFTLFTSKRCFASGIIQSPDAPVNDLA